MTTAPDRFDLAIIAELQRNARITITELASRVGLSKTPCQVRMRRLEKIDIYLVIQH